MTSVRWKTGALVAAALGFSGAPAFSQALPVCKVGQHLDRAGALNYPATIIAFDKAKNSYQVKYDSGGSTEWMTADWLKRGCVSPASAEPVITDAFFAGRWELFVGPYAQYEIIGGNRYLVTGTGAKAPPLEIKADGTYVWVIDKTKTITGRWRHMQPAEMKYGFKDKPGILLMKGYDGGDWQVTRSGTRMTDNRDQLNVERMDLGLSFLATRMK